MSAHPQRPSVVLFDLDGTLVDTAPDFIYCLNLQRALHNLPALPDAEIRAQVSNGARALIGLGFGLTPDDDDYPRQHAELLALYEQHLVRESRLFDGLGDVLALLENAGIAWGVVTNKPRRFSEPLMHGLGLAQRCATLVCPDDVARTKPDPEPLLLACRQVGAHATEGVYVGDHVRDIEAGRSAGMLTVAAGYGYVLHPQETAQWNAAYTVDSGSALYHWLAARIH